MKNVSAFPLASAVIALLLLCGCAAHEVRCAGALEPINVAAPARHPAADADHEE